MCGRKQETLPAASLIKLMGIEADSPAGLALIPQVSTLILA